MSSRASATERKQARIAVRLTPRQDSLIRDAAAVSGQSLTDFITSAALASAEDALADRQVFRLDERAWTQFKALLDRPAPPIGSLSKLLSEQAPWDSPSDIAEV